MTMLYFPYNGMYAASDHSNPPKTITYSVFAAGSKLNFSSNHYLKKDFREASLHNYIVFINHGMVSPQEAYFSKKGLDKKYWQKVIPGKKSASQWLYWWANFGGEKLEHGVDISVYKYSLTFKKNGISIDSSLTILEQ